MGLLFIVIFVLYLIISLIVIGIGMHKARLRGYKRWQGGLLAAFIMYNLLFWDLIPVYVVHGYQCDNNAGFTIHKTLEQWKQENPGVAETLVPIKNSSSIKMGNTTRYQLNQRFAWDLIDENIWYIVNKRDEKIIDIQTGAIVAQYVDFDSNPSQFINANTFNDYKFWFAGLGSCEGRSDGFIVCQDGKSCEWIGKGPLLQQYEFNKLKTQVKYQ